MAKRFVVIWFVYLETDWFIIRHPSLKEVPFVLAAPDHGRMVITSANHLAFQQGVYTGMVVADARAIIPGLQVMDDLPDLPGKLLNRLAEYCIRFSPVVAVDLPNGLLLDVTGCPNLWGGDQLYLETITEKLRTRGYHVRAAIADTIGTAWAMARYGKQSLIVEPGMNIEALLPLPPEALRLETAIVKRLHKLGLRQIKDFISMPRASLRRRFGNDFIKRIDQAMGREEEWLMPVQPIEPYHERLPCLEYIVTATGIEIALQRLLDAVCYRLQQEQKGLRMACLKCYRVDGKMVSVNIGTNRPSNNINHLYKLFELTINTIEPDPGIELFVLEASKVEDISPLQEKIWESNTGLDNYKLAELLDRLAGKVGVDTIHRYLPDEHYIPERSVKLASTLDEPVTADWKTDRPRPLQLLATPELIEVTAPIPDYPPMLFSYKGKLHKIIKADGPERIEQEWWIQEGRHRDYYYVEDEAGQRYWLFRSGHYNVEKTYRWYIHGFFS